MALVMNIGQIPADNPQLIETRWYSELTQACKDWANIGQVREADGSSEVLIFDLRPMGTCHKFQGKTMTEALKAAALAAMGIKGALHEEDDGPSAA